MNLARISIAYLRARPLATALNLLLLALGIATITLLLLATAQLEERMGRDASGSKGSGRRAFTSTGIIHFHLSMAPSISA